VHSDTLAMLKRIASGFVESSLCFIFGACYQRVFTMKIIHALAALVVSIVAFTNCQAQTDSKQNTDNPMEIQRRKIDSLDKKLIEILGARERAVKEIGIYKAKNNMF